MPVTLEEALISLSQATRELPHRPHISTVWRWCTRGVRGIRLETVVIAGRRFTSREALQRFTTASTVAATDTQFQAPSLCERRLRAMERAEKEFDGGSDKTHSD